MNDITLPKFSQKELERKAVVHRNRRLEGKHGHFRASVERAKAEVLMRWQVNYVRHQYTDYDSGASAARRGQINRAIGENYPWLEAEVVRQNEDRARASFLESLGHARADNLPAN